MPRPLLALASLLVLACTATGQPTSQPATPSGTAALADRAPPGKAIATFAGGCFWCMESAFEALDGVESVTSGYTGGLEKGPTYRQVASGGTGHAEAIRVIYDPAKITYAALIEAFWHNIDPTQADGQFCDHGRQYRTGVFFHDEAQRTVAEAFKRTLTQAGTLPGPIVTEITAAGPFFAAEGHHQDYYRTHPTRYRRYRVGCGRDRRLEALWGAAAGH